MNDASKELLLHWPWLNDIESLKWSSIMMSLGTGLPVKVLMMRCNALKPVTTTKRSGKGWGVTYCALAPTLLTVYAARWTLGSADRVDGARIPVVALSFDR